MFRFHEVLWSRPLLIVHKKTTEGILPQELELSETEIAPDVTVYDLGRIYCDLSQRVLEVRTDGEILEEVIVVLIRVRGVLNTENSFDIVRIAPFEVDVDHAF